MAPASPLHARNALMTSLAVAGFLTLMLAGCSNDAAFVAADYAKCRELGFQQASREYDICLSEVQRRRTNLAAAPEPITD
jgi:hypothetical protein